MKILNAKRLRVSRPTLKDLEKIKRQPIVIVLDNVIDTFNIGSFFRLADAISVEKVYLCGKTITPPNIKIHRASIGAWRWVAWEHYPSTLELVKKLKKQGYFLVAAEQGKKSIGYNNLKLKTPVALILGHESRGVSKKVLQEADKIIELPLLGINKSLNVLVAASVILYNWTETISKSKIRSKKSH